MKTLPRACVYVCLFLHMHINMCFQSSEVHRIACKPRNTNSWWLNSVACTQGQLITRTTAERLAVYIFPKSYPNMRAYFCDCKISKDDSVWTNMKYHMVVWCDDYTLSNSLHCTYVYRHICFPYCHLFLLLFVYQFILTATTTLFLSTLNLQCDN